MLIPFDYDHVVTWLLAGCAAFVFVSVLVVLIFDRHRLADHVARSFVQLGIACASVALALFLLERQFSIQDERAFRQQSLAALATIRATISGLAVDVQRAPAFYKDVIRTSCASYEKCGLDPVSNEKYGFQTFTLLEWIIGGVEPQVLVASTTYREPLVQMIRTSSIFPPMPHISSWWRSTISKAKFRIRKSHWCA